MRYTAVLCFVLGSATSFFGAPAPASAQAQVPWKYDGPTGPLNWSKLNPAYQACAKGKEQSPIDIRHAHLDKDLQPIEFHYLAGPVTLENTGNLIVAHVLPGSYIVANGVRYDLQQFEFHHPGQHAVKGRLTDMDVELVHRSADGKLANIEISLALDRGEANATMAALWEHLPTAAGKTEQVAAMVSPGGFLPPDRGYWTYTGSLTTPPCTEGVQWFVFEQPLSISRQQLLTYERLFRVSSRPLQDAHGRRIEASE